MRWQFWTLLVVLFTPLAYAGQPISDSPPVESNLSWVVFCSGDIQKARLVDLGEAPTAKPPFCVRLNDGQFNPLHIDLDAKRSGPWERSAKIWLLVDSGRGEHSPDPWTIEVSIDQVLPQCDKCDATCIKPKTHTQSKIESQVKFMKGRDRVLIDVTKDIKNWHFLELGLQVRVDASLSTFRASQTVRSWPWCTAGPSSNDDEAGRGTSSPD